MIGRLLRVVPREALFCAVAVPALLAVLTVVARMTAIGWAVGLFSGAAITALLVSARRRAGRIAMRPADWITLSRAYLVGGVAAFVVQALVGVPSTAALVVVSALALALDAVDGAVARRTGTASSLGARFDGEVDAYLIALLSVRLGMDYGWWVVAAGAARYAFLVAGRMMPLFARPLPFRYWRKVVTAATGIVFTTAIAAVLPRPVGVTATVIVLALLAESFGRDVLWLYRHGVRSAVRRPIGAAATVASWMLIVLALNLPSRPELLTASAWAAIPVEGIVVGLLAVVLPVRGRRVVGVVAGAALAVLTLEKMLSIGFLSEIGRPFNPLQDWGAIGSAAGVVKASLGPAANTVLGLVLIGAAALAYLIIVAAVRVMAASARHRTASARTLGAVAVVWLVAAATGVHAAASTPVASGATSAFAAGQTRLVWDTARDRARFADDLAAPDPASAQPAADLVGGLRGKDVLVIFVESYGQVAVQGSSFSPAIDAELARDTAELHGAGFTARSAFLDSPTFGGVSWLAHSTLQSGLWVDSSQRYAQLTASHRTTLASAFAAAGWRTVSDIPSDDQPWAAGTSFYRYHKLYDRTNVGYHGPTFSYGAMPDQYTLAAFQRLEMQPGHAPVMAEIDLVSSHTPWTPLPAMVPWSAVGDGSIFDPMPARGLSPEVAWRDPDTVRRLYGESIRYSLRAVTSWIGQLHDDNLVVVLLGDHQPAPIVAGYGANHLVPVSVIAADAGVIDAMACWNWQPGLLPTPSAPARSMDAFRDAFFATFGRAGPGSAGSGPGCLAP
jgi:phosphatidylglycerophosphate synthase